MEPSEETDIIGQMKALEMIISIVSPDSAVERPKRMVRLNTHVYKCVRKEVEIIN